MKTRQPCKFIADIDGVAKFETSFCIDHHEAKSQMVEIYGGNVKISISCFSHTTQGW